MVAGIETEIDYALAAVLPEDEGKRVREALLLEKQADAADAGAQFAAKVTSDAGNISKARLEYGFAESDVELEKQALKDATASEPGLPSGVNA
jgi:hypothetical protein